MGLHEDDSHYVKTNEFDLMMVQPPHTHTMENITFIITPRNLCGCAYASPKLIHHRALISAL